MTCWLLAEGAPVTQMKSGQSRSFPAQRCWLRTAETKGPMGEGRAGPCSGDASKTRHPDKKANLHTGGSQGPQLTSAEPLDTIYLASGGTALLSLVVGPQQYSSHGLEFQMYPTFLTHCSRMETPTGPDTAVKAGTSWRPFQSQLLGAVTRDPQNHLGNPFLPPKTR